MSSLEHTCYSCYIYADATVPTPPPCIGWIAGDFANILDMHQKRGGTGNHLKNTLANFNKGVNMNMDYG